MSDLLYVATRKGLFRYERDTAGWRIADVAFVGEPVSAVLPDPRDGTIYCALNLGHFGVKLHRLEAAGAQWHEVAVPVYPARPAPDDGPDWTLEQIWCLEAGGPDQPGRLWAGTIPGGLFRSDDRGETWTLVRSLWDRPERNRWVGGGYDRPGIHSIAIDPRNANHLTVAVSCGGVWQSHDGGESWNVTSDGLRAAYLPPEMAHDPILQDPHRLVQCAAEPERMWIQHHNGVFTSTDGGRHWTEIEHIEPSTFGFAVAAHPDDPHSAWFVPAVKDECRVPANGAVVVTRTRDGGASFETLRNGLPQSHAYDLVYRHALAIDTSGKRLAMGSTTGSLWITEDQGDHWQSLSSNLPPVHALRFA
ncbi:MAG: hypothetical protein KDG50_07190 [Chromatiales bacterium]|nr:hypothetical protein [Chromatiales bacterium]